MRKVSGINLIVFLWSSSFQMIHRVPLMHPRKPAVPSLAAAADTKTNLSSLKRKPSSIFCPRRCTWERPDAFARCGTHVILGYPCALPKRLSCVISVPSQHCVNWSPFRGSHDNLQPQGIKTGEKGRKNFWSMRKVTCMSVPHWRFAI